MDANFAERGDGRKRGCKEEGGGQGRQRNSKTHDVPPKCPGLTSLYCQRRDFAIEPILLDSEGDPCLRHPGVAPKGGLALGTFGKLQAIFRILSQHVGLFHAVGHGERERENNE